MARRAGVRVIATVGAGDIALVRNLGADEVLDYRAVRVETPAQDVDAVIDLVGGERGNGSAVVLRS